MEGDKKKKKKKGTDTDLWDFNNTGREAGVLRGDVATEFFDEDAVPLDHINGLVDGWGEIGHVNAMFECVSK